MITRTFYKEILPELLLKELQEGLPSLVLSVKTGRHGGWVVEINSNSISAEDDQELARIVNAHIPSDEFLEQVALTEERNKEGFEEYKRIFAHISAHSPVGAIDPFLQAYPSIMIFRCLMKDGQGESALRYVSRTIKPMNLFPHVDLYIAWVREFCKKYNPNLTEEMLDYIENSENA